MRESVVHLDLWALENYRFLMQQSGPRNRQFPWVFVMRRGQGFLICEFSDVSIARTHFRRRHLAGVVNTTKNYAGERPLVNICITMNIYVKSVAESQVDAMDLLGEEFEKQNIIGNPFQQKVQVN